MAEKQKPKRCINIDWLEVHCGEYLDGRPRDAEYFRDYGYIVIEREYGTRVYEQMFTIEDEHGEPWIEVRRLPCGNKTTTGFQVLAVNSCHIRLCNRTCYYTDAAAIMEKFCFEHRYEILRISRLDICLDFERFDSGDKPQDFLSRYLKGRYSKINQSNITAHGKDQWDGRHWNSISWGRPKTMIGTKFYCKSQEIQERKDKPYIRQAWLAAGLVDNWETLEKHKANGTTYKPEIWRLEFSIQSSVKRWYVIEDVHGKKKKLRSIRHTLDLYNTRQKLINHFASLQRHYFFFRKYERDKPKYECPEKVLFNWEDATEAYQLESPASSYAARDQLEILLGRLTVFRETQYDKNIIKAIDILVEFIREKINTRKAGTPEARNEILLLQQLISMRIKAKNKPPLEDDVEVVKALMTLDNKLF